MDKNVRLFTYFTFLHFLKMPAAVYPESKFHACFLCKAAFLEV